MKQNQNGFSHILLIALIALVAGVIGMTGYAVHKSNRPKLSSVNKVTAQNEAAATNANVPKTENTVQSAALATNNPTVSNTEVSPKPTPEASKSSAKPSPTTPKPSSSNAVPTSVPAQAPSPQKRTISFTKGGHSQEGDVIRVSANLSEPQQGTCTYKFSLNGSVRVQETSGITNSNQCFKEIPVSEFPKSATYNFDLSFVSSNGLVSATQGTDYIDIN